MTGEVPRVTDFESGDPHLKISDPNGNVRPDPFADDCSLVVDSDKGLVLILGCAHAGLINIIYHVLEKTGRDRIYAIVGGLHLAPASDEQFSGTLAALRELNIPRIGVAHCTGLRRSAELYAQFPNRTFFASIGSSLAI